MEPVCWLGIVGIVGIGAALYGMFTKSCQGSGSSCGCNTKEEAVVKDSSEVKENIAPASGVDAQKEKAINDLIK